MKMLRKLVKYLICTIMALVFSGIFSFLGTLFIPFVPIVVALFAIGLLFGWFLGLKICNIFYK